VGSKQGEFQSKTKFVAHGGVWLYSATTALYLLSKRAAREYFKKSNGLRQFAVYRMQSGFQCSILAAIPVQGQWQIWQDPDKTTTYCAQ
jgi:hypothetical protein